MTLYSALNKNKEGYPFLNQKNCICDLNPAYNKLDKFKLAMTVVYNLKKVWGYLGKKHKDILEESISQLIQYTNLKILKDLYSKLLQELKSQ